ncbi:hypothetical protein [Stenotrophomonas rhizophila]|uniref:hypothetical protein n=1 Tax=Stenotrophomonas rhizophila TaxID=216778 RepID=UPI003AF4B736
MTPGAISMLDRWAKSPGFRDLTIDEAAEQLEQLVPQYPHPADQPVEICVNGYRWFGSEMEAVADAIHRAARRPHGADETLAGPDWNSDISYAGLWALPGRCKRVSRVPVDCVEQARLAQ